MVRIVTKKSMSVRRFSIPHAKKFIFDLKLD